jgi:hypothetical protein
MPEAPRRNLKGLCKCQDLRRISQLLIRGPRPEIDDKLFGPLSLGCSSEDKKNLGLKIIGQPYRHTGVIFSSVWKSILLEDRRYWPPFLTPTKRKKYNQSCWTEKAGNCSAKGTWIWCCILRLRYRESKLKEALPDHIYNKEVRRAASNALFLNTSNALCRVTPKDRTLQKHLRHSCPCNVI